ncbi:Membrane-bound lytic murein transglycosylase B precursor [Hartmannibacter diazotrophicus]|uniref:Membrane-bound lytic murein transglycosylase B n=1 Tax=Hartmannibacter diazotrophicus TaxID=1482074 RepID=A0A2C9D3X7_9HYPH|nr:lytic murein transglycosylase [Hartmannibacter diazotrophicus]SON55002.1 Membrane-bound lytic murein transglycosylase B precursor [Hartmannibacter diazotrophicus]
MLFKSCVKFVAACAFLAAGSLSSAAATCGNTADGFNAWLTDFQQLAMANGISQSTLNQALSGVSYDRKAISLDRGQKKTFSQSFEKFASTRANAGAIALGKKAYKRNAQLLSQVEAAYGVPGEVVVALWGLETGFGNFSGNKGVFAPLATLAYDCRRSAFFTNELISALKILQRGDLTLSEMKGAGFGELGQTQFLPSKYLAYAVDGDGDGRRDLIRSVPDVLYSTANYLRGHGWIPGAGYQEGEPNFKVFNDWNLSTVYQQTIAYYAGKIAAN